MQKEKLAPEAEKLWNKWLKKSKKVCVLCDREVRKLKPGDKISGRVWCQYVKLQHPNYKSKLATFCGDCYSAVLNAK